MKIDLRPGTLNFVTKEEMGAAIVKKIEIRKFETGATRDTEAGKPDYEGFLSPLVMEAFGVYMDFNRHMADGSTRDSDNWQKGIPTEAYMKSGWRHFVDWWRVHRGLLIKDNVVWAICALIFNAQGYLHETLKKNPELLQLAREQMEKRRVRDRGSAPARSGG